METGLLLKNIVDSIEKAIIGKTDEIYNIMKGIIADGHILIEDVPGVGKTTLVKALAKSLNLSCSRIQFTPDLLPSDITGVSIYNQKSMQFEFKKGPVFSNIVLADEINRTSPKTQSALLEVMEEKQVSEGNQTYILEKPFIVLATENPVEHEGTFVLPEAQLDRFMIKISIGYPSNENEAKILERYRDNQPMNDIVPVATAEDIKEIQNSVRNVKVNKELYDYIVRITSSTRNTKYLTLGASPRASLSLLRIAQATALINGRSYVIPEDIKSNVILVMAHRVSLSSTARANNLTSESILNDIIKNVPAPKI